MPVHGLVYALHMVITRYKSARWGEGGRTEDYNEGLILKKITRKKKIDIHVSLEAFSSVTRMGDGRCSWHNKYKRFTICMGIAHTIIVK